MTTSTMRQALPVAVFTLCFLQHVCQSEAQRLGSPTLPPRRHDGSDPPRHRDPNAAWHRDGHRAQSSFTSRSGGHFQDTVTLTAAARPLRTLPSRRLRVIQKQAAQADKLANKLPMLTQLQIGSSNGTTTTSSTSSGSMKRTDLALTPPMG